MVVCDVPVAFQRDSSSCVHAVDLLFDGVATMLQVWRPPQTRRPAVNSPARHDVRKLCDGQGCDGDGAHNHIRIAITIATIGG